jgi:exodeoxyribonuclease VII large subunit
MLAGSSLRLSDGIQIRCRGGLDFYAPAGRVQLAVREVDPTFSLGLLEKRRRETLAALAAAGLLERQRGLVLPDLPLTLGLVTSHGSAAYHDFLSGLAESGYGFKVYFVHAAVQGREAEREVASALSLLGRFAIDCAVLIRGGGAKTDLAAFDSRAIAEAVARAPFPVLTGLGHEIDRAIADLVAHTALKTPTKVAERLVEQVAQREAQVADLRRALLREALEPLRSARQALGRAERGARLARMRLRSEAVRLVEHAQALARLGRSTLRLGERRRQEFLAGFRQAAPSALERAETKRHLAGRRGAASARARLREVRVRLDGLERLCSQLAPQRTLERGFSLTRDAAGRIVRNSSQVAAGDLLTTSLSQGSVTSRVESI